MICKMSIWVKIKVTDDMKAHVRSYSEMYFNEVIQKACLTPKEVALLFYMMEKTKKKAWWPLFSGTKSFIGNYSSMSKALNKLVTLGLITKEKNSKDKRETLYFYEEDKKDSRV